MIIPEIAAALNNSKKIELEVDPDGKAITSKKLPPIFMTGWQVVKKPLELFNVYEHAVITLVQMTKQPQALT